MSFLFFRSPMRRLLDWFYFIYYSQVSEETFKSAVKLKIFVDQCLHRNSESSGFKIDLGYFFEILFLILNFHNEIFRTG